MPVYTNVFGGATIYPSEISYSSLTLTSDVVLSWPQETSANENLATRIMDIQSASSSYFIYLPEADKTATGQTILFNNVGAHTIIVKDADGTQVVSVSAGTLWQIYLTNNSTAAGTWQALQYGASISQANASSLAGTGIVAVGTLLSQSVPISSFNTNYSAGITDRAIFFAWSGANGTFTLPSPSLVGANWFCYLRNNGTGSLSAACTGAVTINGSSAKTFQPGDSAIIATDGISYYTIGFGQANEYAFTFTVITVSGSGNYVLSGVELNQTAYRFNGTLTGNRVIIVPPTVQQYWVDNQTNQPYTLTVKTASGSGVVVAQNARNILYCDGTNVVNADTGAVSLPVAINQGGTGSTSAAGALINLGGEAVGISVFQSATQAAAWSALGVAQAGVVDGGTF